ncbi:hypothetical protein As57867_007290, partial [Aphanomyces stellatus]
MATPATTFSNASSCPYKNLPSIVTSIGVWDQTYCGTTDRRCIVDKSCQNVNATTFQAIGSFKDVPGFIIGYITGPARPIDLSMMVLPNSTTEIHFDYIDQFNIATSFQWPAATETISFLGGTNITTPSTWPRTLTALHFNNTDIKAWPDNVPQIRLTSIIGNPHFSDKDIKQLPSSLTYLLLDGTSITQLASFNGSKLDSVYGIWNIILVIRVHRLLLNNAKMNRISYLPFRSSPKYVYVVNMTITNWIMDLTSYNNLNGLSAGYVEARDGYDCINSTIDSDATECNNAKGTIMELFTNKTGRQ